MLEEYLDGILQELLVSPAVSSFKVLRQEAGDESGFIRIKCILPNGDILEFAFPHHIHLSDGKVVGSDPMTPGKVLMDIEKTISVDVE